MLTFLVILGLIKMGLEQWKEDRQEKIEEDFESHWHENTPL